MVHFCAKQKNMESPSKDLSRLLEEIDKMALELAGLSPMSRDNEDRLWRKFRLEWSWNSNHIEGNTLTYHETELYLIFDQAPTTPHTRRELEEMGAHDVAVALIRKWASETGRTLTEADIRTLNETILVRPFWKDAETSDGQKTRRLIAVGQYKEHPNHVRLPNGEIFRYAELGDVAQEMADLIHWYRSEGAQLHPAVTAALLHYRFVRIHPFDDGNGRIARLLMNYHLLRNNLPPVVIKSADKRNYLFALQKADVGDLDAFCVYIAEQVVWSLDLSISASRGERIEERGDWEKEVTLLRKKLELEKNISDQLVLNENKGTLRWLERNFSILKAEMEHRIGVFTPFFEQNRLMINIRTRGGREIDMVTEKLDWKQFVDGMYKNEYSSRISLGYYFDHFLYKPTKIAIIKNPHIDIYIEDSLIRIVNSIDKNIFAELSIQQDIQKEDLAPIEILGQLYRQHIEEAKGK